MISSFRMNIKERSARMEKYAKVIVKNNSQYTDNLFTYKVPEFLQDEICLGHRVLVPFGKGNKPIEAYVFKIIDNNDEDIKTKYIYDILDERPILKRQDLELIHWMKNRYLCTYMDCINLIIPKGYKLNNYKSITLHPSLKNIDTYEIYDLSEKLSENKRFVLQSVLDNKGKIKLDKLVDKKIEYSTAVAEESELYGIKDKKNLKRKVTDNLNSLLYKMKEESLIDLRWEYKSIKNEIKRYLFFGWIIKKHPIGRIRDNTSSLSVGDIKTKMMERYKIIGMTFSIDK